jgi:general secretion pathway protein M
MSALSNLRESAGRAFQRPAAYFMGEWERLSPRRKSLVTWLAVAIVIVSIALGALLSMNSISDLEDGNAAIREALAAIAKHHDEYLDAKARNAVQEARIGDAPPQLAGDLEAAAHAENIQIAESSERPTVPAGRRYLEHDTDIKIQRTDLQSLTNFLKRVETGPRLIFFTRLAIRHRYSSEDADKLDVELTATAFEKVHEDKTKKKGDGQDKPDKSDKQDK